MNEFGWPFVSIACLPLWLRILRRVHRRTSGGYLRFDRYYGWQVEP